jgi:hypothetical protein
LLGRYGADLTGRYGWQSQPIAVMQLHRVYNREYHAAMKVLGSIKARLVRCARLSRAMIREIDDLIATREKALFWKRVERAQQRVAANPEHWFFSKLRDIIFLFSLPSWVPPVL